MDALGLTQQLASHVIRPARANYTIEELGQKIFQYKGIVYERTDFTIPANNPFTLKIGGSIYYDRFSKGRKPRPTVLYLHANSSSRMTVKNYLKNLIQYFDVVAFDFRGCGLSEGKYLTLGYLEKYDVQAVIEYVEKYYGGERRWMIWGRSMGAVTAILYTAKFMLNSQKIASLVLDSPFADLQKTIHFLADKKVPLLPKFMVESAIENLEEYVKQRILQEYKKLFFIRKHKPINEISKIRVPIFFIGSKNDQIVDSNHVQKLYDNAYTKKQLEMLEGGHNEIRPDHLKVAVIQFLHASLNMKKQGNLRKRIFAYGPNKSSPFGEQGTSNNLSKSQPKNEPIPKSKSRPKNRLFANQPNQTPSQLETQNQMAKLNLNSDKITLQQKIASKKQTQQTHVQILDKVLPQSSSRRNNRIFTHAINTNPDKDKDNYINNRIKESEDRNDIL